MSAGVHTIWPTECRLINVTVAWQECSQHPSKTDAAGRNTIMGLICSLLLRDLNEYIYLSR